MQVHYHTMLIEDVQKMFHIEKMLLFRVDSICNNILNSFSEFVEEQLRHIGVRCDYVDLTKSSAEALNDLTQKLEERYDVALAFNAGGVQNININDENIFDHYGVSFFNYIVDHPADHYTSLTEHGNNYHVLCMDANHEELIRDFCPRIRSVHFLPLGGLSTTGEIRPLKEREYDVVFTGGFLSQTPRELLEVFKSFPSPQKDILFYMIDFLLDDSKKDAYEALCYVLKDKYGIEKIEPEMRREYMKLMQGVQMFMRTYPRESILRHLLASDLNFHIFGNGWKERMGDYCTNTVFHQGVLFRETGQIYDRAKIVLNILPWFKHGTHDRIASGLLHGAAVLTDQSTYLEKMPQECITFYDAMKPEKMVDQIKTMLQNESYLQGKADHGYNYAKEHLTWKQNVEKMLDIMSNVI